MTAPLRFAFGIHFHQPVGNFDSVFADHVVQVYRPLIEALEGGGCWPITLHVSGPLLEWLGRHEAGYLDRLATHIVAGRIELLLSGFDEPILAMLSREDRLEQITTMRAALADRFGVTATGLWLTERVWEPDLARDLADAGVRYVLVDDRHFRVAGFDSGTLYRWFTTEAGGRSLGVFPIDERLRYLVPFRPPAELAAYFRELRAAGHPLAILADDGEKFGGWPGTREWVYDKGWMAEFLATINQLRDAGEVTLVTFSQALAEVPSGGLAYLPSASYREMEGWALPPTAALRLGALEYDLGAERAQGQDGALVRGTHWKNFLIKYPESNRLHKKMSAISDLARERGDPAPIRRAIGRAQCNDAYWHGVFGGLYLPFLRGALWRELARAEAGLRAGESLGVDPVDLDRDGYREIWVHSDRFSAIVAPARGGAIEEWTSFPAEQNLADVLTRRQEAYHDEALARAASAGTDQSAGGTESIHDLEARLQLSVRPPYDRDTRAILQERLLPARVTEDAVAAGQYDVTRSWVAEAGSAEITTGDDHLTITLGFDGLTKRLRFDRWGNLVVEFTWVPPADGAAAWFATELSLAREVTFEAPGAILWRYPIETVAKSERGFDRTLQGHAVMCRWPIGAGQARLAVTLP